MSNPTTTERVTAAVAEHPGYTQPKLALAAGVSRSTVSTVITQLVKDGVVVATRPTGRGATTYTLAVADVPAPAETDTCAACELGADDERGPVQTYDDVDGAYHQDCAEEIQASAAEHTTPTVAEPQDEERDERRGLAEVVYRAGQSMSPFSGAAVLAAATAATDTTEETAGEDVAPVVTKLTGLSALQVRALRELRDTVGVDDLAKTWVALVGTPTEALARVHAAREALTDRKAHPYASLHAVVRKLEKLAGALEPTTMTEEDVTTAAEAVRERKAATAKAPKAKAEPKRKPLPEGYVSVMGLTHEINRRGLYKGNRADGLLTGQAMYTYINANRGEDKAHPFPIITREGQVAIPLEEGIQWWIAKDARVAEKAEAKAEAEAAKASKGTAKKPAAKTSK